MHTHSPSPVLLPPSLSICSSVCEGASLKYFVDRLLQADNKVTVLDVDSTPIVLNHRLTNLNTPTLEKTSPNHLSLQEVLIVGNSNEQVC